MKFFIIITLFILTTLTAHSQKNNNLFLDRLSANDTIKFVIDPDYSSAANILGNEDVFMITTKNDVIYLIAYLPRLEYSPKTIALSTKQLNYIKRLEKISRRNNEQNSMVSYTWSFNKKEITTTFHHLNIRKLYNYFNLKVN